MLSDTARATLALDSSTFTILRLESTLTIPLPVLFTSAARMPLLQIKRAFRTGQDAGETASASCEWSTSPIPTWLAKQGEHHVTAPLLRARRSRRTALVSILVVTNHATEYNGFPNSDLTDLFRSRPSITLDARYLPAKGHQQAML